MSTSAPASPAQRCGIDSVEIARIERLLRETSPQDLLRFFTAQELADAGDGPGRAASLAARFAAKEACVKLFPREAALAQIEPHDFSVARDNFGAPQVVLGPRAELLAGRHRLGPIALSMTHDRGSAQAVAITSPLAARVPLAGRILYRLFPFRRRVILDNLRRVYGATLDEDAIVDLAQAHYGHLWRLAGEFLRFRWQSRAAQLASVRVDNLDAFVEAYLQGRGVLLLTGHFGNWEVATVAGIGSFPQMRGRFHFVRRALKPDWFDRLITRRFQKAGFGVLPKRGSLDAMLDRLAHGDAIVFAFDQHASPPDGIAVDFFGHPAWTFKSLAIIALATGAPVVPATSWREPDGKHVLRFEAPIAPVEHASTNEAIRLTTRAYNEALERLVLRRPEQWYWVHRRWKEVAVRSRKRKLDSANAAKA
ncbi:MAG: 4'-phosphopantetheinyl transferase superfamily protein [Burkholderiales bacterium]